MCPRPWGSPVAAVGPVKPRSGLGGRGEGVDRAPGAARGGWFHALVTLPDMSLALLSISPPLPPLRVRSQMFAFIFHLLSNWQVRRWLMGGRPFPHPGCGCAPHPCPTGVPTSAHRRAVGPGSTWGVVLLPPPYFIFFSFLLQKKISYFGKSSLK